MNYCSHLSTMIPKTLNYIPLCKAAFAYIGVSKAIYRHFKRIKRQVTLHKKKRYGRNSMLCFTTFDTYLIHRAAKLWWEKKLYMGNSGKQAKKLLSLGSSFTDRDRHLRRYI